MKVVPSETGNSFDIVPDCWGTEIKGKSTPTFFKPVPFARFPVGHCRIESAASMDAHWTLAMMSGMDYAAHLDAEAEKRLKELQG